jgi:hypothetical protein
LAKYKVMREHLGDKFYLTGEQREANPVDVKHLVAKGILVELGEGDKPKPAPKTPTKKVNQNDRPAES